MKIVTLGLVAAYAVAVLLLSRSERSGDTSDFLLAGRRLTLPAFVATLVTTWYGGILGVGEYAWSYGISTWLVFGLPYYLAALIFAVCLAPRLRRSGAITIPDLLRSAYGGGAAVTGAAAVFALALPVAYVLILATLITGLTGCSVLTATVAAALFSAVYVGLSGFRAVVRTDALQMALMYGGFFLLLPAAVHHAGGFASLWSQLPADHKAWDGGLGWQTVLVWYLIAMQTVVDPGFYQRVFAARSPATARRGVLVSIVLWAVFDFCTTFSGLAARVLLPNLSDPVQAFPALAELVLPAWLVPVFTLGLFATVMSTLDSNLFISATTLGHDLDPQRGNPLLERRRTRYGLAVSAVLAAGGALLFRSPVQVWHHVGSVITAALLLPIVAVHLAPRWRFSQPAAVASMLGAAAVAIGWILLGDDGGYPLGVEPMFPALAVSAACWGADLLVRAVRRSN